MSFIKIGDLDLGMTYNYTVTPKLQDKKIRMASGTLVTEKRNSKWEIKIVYKYLTDTQRAELYSRLDNVPDGGIPITFYNPSGNQETAFFSVISIPSPKIARFNGNVPDVWADVGFTLEEV